VRQGAAALQSALSLPVGATQRCTPTVAARAETFGDDSPLEAPAGATVGAGGAAIGPT
jgi:hypothetical protein